MSTDTAEYDVAIVGAGLVGATLAALLATNPATANLTIALIDRHPPPQPIDTQASPPVFDSRVVALTPQSEQLLANIGAWADIRSKRLCSYQRMYVWDDEGTGAIEFDARAMRQPALGTIVENNIALNAVLAILSALPTIDCQFGVGLSALDRSRGRVQLTLGDQQTLTASLVVAADGALSRVRQLVGLPMRQWHYGQQALVATVNTEHHHQHTAWQNFLRSGPLALLPLGEATGHYGSIVWSADTIVAKQLQQLTNEAFTDNLGRALGDQLGAVGLVTERQVFPLVQRHAQHYFTDQVVLVGDAAHTLHPLAGQGVNLGLLDAKVLATELARACDRGLSPAEPSLLARYQRQRKPHNMQMMAVMEGFKRLFGESRLDIRWLRNQGLRSINAIQPAKHWLAKQAMGI